MSLLDGGANYEPVIVYPEVSRRDADGNIVTEASTTGVPDVARFQVLNQSGTSSRRQEQDNEGFESEKVYGMRFPRSSPFHSALGAQAEIDWNGQRWVVFGDPNLHNGSPRTRHATYTIKRY
jgi:hypothetical protein